MNKQQYQSTGQKTTYRKRVPMYKQPRSFAGNRLNSQFNPSHFQSKATGIKGETKAVDLQQATYTLNSTAVLTPLNLIQAGSSFFNRIGRKIHMKSIAIRGFIGFSGNSQVIAAYGRIMIVYDRQTNGALPVISDILLDTKQDATTSTGALSGLNLNNRDRFVVIADKKFMLPVVTQAVGIPTFIAPSISNDTECEWGIVDRYHKINMETQYKADSSPAVIGDIATGALYLITFGQATAGNEGWNVTLATRLRYVDQ